MDITALIMDDEPHVPDEICLHCSKRAYFDLQNGICLGCWIEIVLEMERAMALSKRREAGEVVDGRVGHNRLGRWKYVGGKKKNGFKPEFLPDD